MDKITYLAELAEGLARWVPERERQDILRYYAEYFEEAGPGREAEVISELGDPWALSCRLAVEGGYVTADQAASWTPKKKRKWPWVLAGVAAVLVLLVGSLIPVAMQVTRNAAQFIGHYPVTTQAPYAIIDAVEEANIPAEAQTTYISGEEGFWSMGDGSLGMFESIDADISLGNITVTDGEDFTLWIDGTGGYNVSWEIKDGVLKLRDDGKMKQVEVSSWDDVRSIFGGSVRGIDVVVTVPEGFELNKVKLNTDLGDIFLSGLAVSGDVEAETSMGNVECYEVSTANKIDLSTSMGDVTLGIELLYGGMEIDLETSMGNVEAQMGCKESICEYDLETSMGTVTVNGIDRGHKAEHKGSGPYRLEAESDMGDVNVYFYDDRWQ